MARFDGQKTFLLLVVIILLAGLALELMYIESILSNMGISGEENCKNLCNDRDKISYFSHESCYCKDPIIFERNFYCFPNITLQRDQAFSDKFNTSEVRDIAVSSVVKYDRPNTEATKVFAVYNEMINRIFYISDPRQDEYIASPIETWNVQGGDCDDSSILLASLYEAVGLDSIIAEVYNETYGHVFVVVNIEQDLNTFLNFYKLTLEKYTPYSGKIQFNFIVFGESRDQCSSVYKTLNSGGSVRKFGLVIESTTKDYAGSFDPIEGFENVKFIEVGS